MSIVPRQGVSSDPQEDLFPLELWDDPFFLLRESFPSPFPAAFPLLNQTQTQVNWRETPRAHVLRAAFATGEDDHVLVYIDDENTLEISTENGGFMTKFKLPDNARRGQVKASMVGGVLTVVVPKEGASPQHSPNVRAIEIQGSG